MARFESQFIYLLRDRESMRLGENVYKVGKTRQGTERLKGYSKGSELLLMVQVPDCDLLERLILADFVIFFTQRLERGVEYFEGDPIAMCNTIYQYFGRVAGQLDFGRHKDESAPEPTPSMAALFKEKYVYKGVFNVADVRYGLEQTEITPPNAPKRGIRKRSISPPSPSLRVKASAPILLVDDEITSMTKTETRKQLKTRGVGWSRSETFEQHQRKLRRLVYSEYDKSTLERLLPTRGLCVIHDEPLDDLRERLCLSYY
jgi:hypothetical protein